MATTTTRRSARISAVTSSKPATPAKEKPVTSRPHTPKETSDKALEESRKRKSIGEAQTEAPDFAVPAIPDTKRRRTAKKQTAAPTTPKPIPIQSAPPSLQPTASNVSITSRPAEPHATNAPLSTPHGSRITAYSNTSPVKWSGLQKPTTTTDTLLTDACAHLISVNPRMAPLIAAHTCKMYTPEGLRQVIDPFASLASSILGQQVSGAAAAAIKKRFVALFKAEEAPDDYFPPPAEVAKRPLPDMRTAGLSQRKAEYISGLAEKFASGELSARSLISASDEDLMKQLIAVRGLGQWSVEMFAMFGLKRMDVFSTGDLGIQRGMAAFAGRDVAKLKNKGAKNKWKYMTEKEMIEMAEPYRPYRSLFSWYMWRVEEVDTSVLEG